MAAAEAKTNDAEAPAPPKIIYATNPEPTVAHGAAKDVTDCDYGRLLLRRWGVPKSRFIGNMLILAALSGRVLVVPEVQCDTLVVDSVAAHWKETRRRRQERRCAWVPPKPCWQLEYMTTLELQRKASLDPTLARRLKLLRNRTDTHLARLNASSGSNGGVPIASASTRAARRKVESAACEAGGALASVPTRVSVFFNRVPL